MLYIIFSLTDRFIYGKNGWYHELNLLKQQPAIFHSEKNAEKAIEYMSEDDKDKYKPHAYEANHDDISVLSNPQFNCCTKFN